MREYQKKGTLKASPYTLVSRKFNLLFTLYTYVVANILQNGARFRYEKTGLKNYRNLKNFRQAVESPKSLKLMGCYPKKYIPSAKIHMQWIYLKLLSTTCE